MLFSVYYFLWVVVSENRGVCFFFRCKIIMRFTRCNEFSEKMQENDRTTLLISDRNKKAGKKLSEKGTGMAGMAGISEW